MNMKSGMRLAGLAVALVAAMAGTVIGGEVRLAEKGAANCVIVVPPGSMTWEGDKREVDHWGANERRNKPSRAPPPPQSPACHGTIEFLQSDEHPSALAQPSCDEPLDGLAHYEYVV